MIDFLVVEGSLMLEAESWMDNLMERLLLSHFYDAQDIG